MLRRRRLPMERSQRKHGCSTMLQKLASWIAAPAFRPSTWRIFLIRSLLPSPMASDLASRSCRRLSTNTPAASVSKASRGREVSFTCFFPSRDRLQESMDLTPVTLEGAAVRLEPLSIEHLNGLLEAGADPELWRYMTSDCSTQEGMREFIEEALAGQRAVTTLPFATIDRKSGKPIGSTRFGNIVPEHKRVEIGWTWISPPWQRSAINTEAKYLMFRHAFETLGCNRVEL